MKKLKFIKTALLSLTAMAFLSSCLKDPRYVNFPSTVATVELPGATGVGPSGGAFQAQSFSISTTATPFNVQVNYAGATTAPSAITVKLSVDQAALTAYNTANGTNYTLLPAADYSSSLTATIAAGQQSANVVVNINTSVIDPSQSYVLPLTITDGGGQQISNWKTILYNVQVKNKYDGVYTNSGTLTDATVLTITGNYPRTVSLITQGGATNAYFDNGLNNYAHSILSGGSASSYGNFGPIFTFDPSTNKITAVTNAYGQGTNSQGRGAALDPTGVNAFVSGTPGTVGAVFKVKYFLTVNGLPRTTFDETFTYKSAR